MRCSYKCFGWDLNPRAGEPLGKESGIGGRRRSAGKSWFLRAGSAVTQAEDGDQSRLRIGAQGRGSVLAADLQPPSWPLALRAHVLLGRRVSRSGAYTWGMNSAPLTFSRLSQQSHVKFPLNLLCFQKNGKE